MCGIEYLKPYTGYKTLASPLLLLFRAQRALWRVAASFWLGMVVVCRTFLILTKGNCFQKDIKGSNVENTVRKSARDISGLCYCCGGKFLGYYSTRRKIFVHSCRRPRPFDVDKKLKISKFQVRTFMTKGLPFRLSFLSLAYLISYVQKVRICAAGK